MHDTHWVEYMHSLQLMQTLRCIFAFIFCFQCFAYTTGAKQLYPE